MFNLDHIKVSPFDERTAPSGVTTAECLAQAATRVLRALHNDDEQEIRDSESSLIAQLQAEEFVPSDWVMSVEHGCAEHSVVHVFCYTERLVEPPEECYLIINPTTGEVQRV